MGEVVPVHPQNIASVWSAIEPFVEKCLPGFHGTYETLDFRRACERGEMLLWVALDDEKKPEAAIITRLQEYPRARHCNVLVVGGQNMRGWFKPANEALERYALAMGCSAMEGGFRRGWIRAAGYTEISRVLFKRL